MPILLSVQATEKSTYKITVSFTDEEGDPVVPNWIKWTLSTSDGKTIINDKEREEISSDSTVNIVLSGDDLQILTEETNDEFAIRKITIESEYDSDIGSDLPLTESGVFMVRNLSYIS